MSLYAETLNHSISNSQPLNKQELETIFGVGASQHIAAHQLNYLTKDQTQATKGKAGPLLPIMLAAGWGAFGAANSYLTGGTSREIIINGLAGTVGGATGWGAVAGAGRAGLGLFGTSAAGLFGGGTGGLVTNVGLHHIWRK